MERGYFFSIENSKIFERKKKEKFEDVIYVLVIYLRDILKF